MTQQSDERGRQPAAEGGDDVERELARFLGPAREPAPDVADLFGNVQTQIARERGLSAWLRSRATWLRAAIALALIASPALITTLAWLRPDMGGYPVARMAMVLAAITLPMIAGIALVLRPLHRPALPASLANATIAGALLGLLALYSWPIGSAGMIRVVAPASGVAALLAGARSCALIGLLLAAAVFFALRALDRGGTRRSLLRATAAGLCANMVLQLHCPNTAPLHILLGHFAVLVVLLALVALWPRTARG